MTLAYWTCSLLLTGLAVGTQHHTPPTFARDFKSRVQTDIVLKSGQSTTRNGGACCSPDTPGCQLQGIFSLDELEEQGSMQRSRRATLCSDGPCILASLYGKVMATMKLAPGGPANSSHEFVCNEYCPLTGSFHSEVQIGHIDKQSGRVRYLGSETISQEGPGATSRAVDHYQWSEMLLHLLPLETTDFYVDTSGEAAVPFFSSLSPIPRVIKGRVPDVRFNSSFLAFAAANLTGRFDIDHASFAACPRSPGCNQDVQARRFGRSALPGSFERLAAAQPASVAVVSTMSPPPSSAKPLPTFPADYTAREETRGLSNQGGVFVGDDVCCLPTQTHTLSGECLVNRAYQRGTRYHDVTNQRERFEDEASGRVMVTLYSKSSEGKDMLINVTGGVETCEEFCPMLTGETLKPLALDPNATDAGPATVLGQSVERFEWANYAKIPITGRLIKMETVEFYTTRRPAALTPVFAETKLTPYGGPQTGTQNTTYTQFVAATPPAAKFVIAGIDTCPQAKNCQIEMWQTHRLAARRYRAFYHHQ